jgi:hypothetical protein
MTKLPGDTSRIAHERQLEAIRRLSPARRLEIAASMSDEVRALAEAGVRSRRPELTPEQVRDATADLLLGRSVAERARRNRPAAR